MFSDGGSWWVGWEMPGSAMAQTLGGVSASCGTVQLTCNSLQSWTPLSIHLLFLSSDSLCHDCVYTFDSGSVLTTTVPGGYSRAAARAHSTLGAPPRLMGHLRAAYSIFGSPRASCSHPVLSVRLSLPRFPLYYHLSVSA